MNLDDLRHKAESGDREAQFRLGWLHESSAYIVEGGAGTFLEMDTYESSSNFEDWIQLIEWKKPSRPQLEELKRIWHGWPSKRESYEFSFRMERLPEAVKWYKQAAQQEHPMAMWRLAQAYLFGWAIEKDEGKANGLFRRLAEGASPAIPPRLAAEAATRLGFSYEKGHGVNENPIEAAMWYRRAAEKGIVEAQLYLGNMYKDGRGVPKDRGTARRWLRKVIDSSENWAHCEYAIRDLERLEVNALPEALQSLKGLVGLKNVKAEVQKLVDLVEIQRKRRAAGMNSEGVSLHLVFAGNPGTGKTTVARCIGEIYAALGLLANGHLVEVNRNDLVAGYIGQTEERTKTKISEALDGVLFVDEAYSLNVEDSPNDFGKDAVATLVAEMENHRDRLAVIVAGYTDKMRKFINMNEGLSSRFSRPIHFEDYKPDELMQIFVKLAENENYRLDETAESELCKHLEIVQAMDAAAFGNGRGVRNIFEQVKERHAMRVKQLGMEDADTLSTLTVADLPVPQN